MKTNDKARKPRIKHTLRRNLTVPVTVGPHTLSIGVAKVTDTTLLMEFPFSNFESARSVINSIAPTSTKYNNEEYRKERIEARIKRIKEKMESLNEIKDSLEADL